MPVIESLDTLLEWMQEDPVDTWEMSRNDCVQQVQGNRNVFIDYPEFAWLLFGRELPADYDTPSGYAHEHGSDVENFTLTAASSDETRGTVTVRSHTVTAFPAEGYCVGGYTLTPADAAVVKQNGNVFTVSRMTKDCTLTVQFDPRTPSTVHFSVPEGVTAPADAAGYTGDTLPSRAVPARRLTRRTTTRSSAGPLPRRRTRTAARTSPPRAQSRCSRRRSRRITRSTIIKSMIPTPSATSTAA